MLWLEAHSRYNIIKYEPDDAILRWRFDVKALSAEGSTGPESYTVGRIVCDELRRFELFEQGEHPWVAADADSSGLEEAYSALCDEAGNLREEKFESAADPIVYVYRFELHQEFANCRMAVIESFCRFFRGDAVILAQYRTTRVPLADFKSLGFLIWTPAGEEPPMSPAEVEKKTDFLIRDMALLSEYEMQDFPEECADGRPEHEQWVASAHKWDQLH